MVYVILPNLQVIFLFIHTVVESFKKVFIHRFAIGSIVVYCTTIIPNIKDKVVYCIKVRVVKGWSI